MKKKTVLKVNGLWFSQVLADVNKILYWTEASGIHNLLPPNQPYPLPQVTPDASSSTPDKIDLTNQVKTFEK